MLGDIVAALREYTVNHFKTEEQYFTHSGYPDVEQHRKIHRDFVATVEETARKLTYGQAVYGDELLQFLKNWLLNHIRVMDHQYAPFVKARLFP